MNFNKIVHNLRTAFALWISLLDIPKLLEARILRQPPASTPEWPEALPICDQGYLIVWEAVVSLSLLVHDIFCSLLSDGVSLSLYLAVCRFSPVSVLHVLLQCRHFKCSLDFSLALLTGYNGEVWVLGRVLFEIFSGTIIFI